MKRKNIVPVLAASVTMFIAAQTYAATYCGWIDDAKFGATLTDKDGPHSLSDVHDQKSGDIVYKIQTTMKSWPSCGCITGKLGKTNDFDVITGFSFKPIKACQDDPNLEEQ